MVNSKVNILNKDKKTIKKILNIPFSIDEIKEKSPLFRFDFKGLELSFVLCSNEEIKKINKEYRNIDKETDVITFALFVDDINAPHIGDIIYLGEIFIAPDVAKSQAKTTLDDEINTLICHGILHLLGFDHQTDRDYNFIVNTQDKVIKE